MKVESFSMLRSVVTISLVVAGVLLAAVDEASSLPAGGVFSPEAEKLFARGLEAYKKERYRKAQEHFQRLLEFPLNQRSSAGQLMLGKTLFRLEEYQAALAAAKVLQRRYTESRYVPDARLLAGDCYYVLRRYYEAATQYGRILATPARLELQSRAAERLAGIVKNGFISVKALESIRMAVGANRIREALLFGEARWYQRLGWEAQSRAALQGYRDSVPEGIFASLVDLTGPRTEKEEAPSASPEPETQQVRPSSRRERPERRSDAQLPRLGLLLPLSGPWRQIGEDLFAGVQLANEQLGESFELVVADIGFEYGDLPIVESEGGQLLRVVHETRYLIEEEQVLAIIGPVFSNACVAAGAVAEAAGIPLIAPLAQQSGLDSLGQHLFQLNTIPELQGRTLGEYATLVLGLQTLVVIAPLSDYGWNFEREFTSAAHANGGDVVHVDWYIPDETKDFKHVFEEVRRVGFSLMPPPPPEDPLAEVDSLAWTMLDSSLESGGPSFLTELLAGLEGEEEPEVEEEPTEEEAPPDSSEIFIDTLDGIVIVVESFEDAKTIAPQLHFHRLQTQILGNDTWYEPEAIRQMRPGDRSYIEGTIFVSGYQEGTSAGRDFIDGFRRRFARDAGYAAYGYDAARLVIGGWEEGGQNPGALREWLAEVRGFEGASGRISFSPGRRTNSELVLVKIDGRGRVRRLGSQDLPDLSAEEEDLPQAELDLPEAELLLEELEQEE